MRQHDALRVRGRAGCVEDGRRVLFLGGTGRERERGSSSFIAKVPRQGADAERMLRPLSCGVGTGQIGRRGEQQRRARVRHDGFHLIRPIGSVDGDRDGAEAKDAEICGAPGGAVLPEDGAAILLSDPQPGQMSGKLFRLTQQSSVVDAIDGLPPLIQDGCTIRRAIHRTGEALPEIVHAGSIRATGPVANSPRSNIWRDRRRCTFPLVVSGRLPVRTTRTSAGATPCS